MSLSRRESRKQAVELVFEQRFHSDEPISETYDNALVCREMSDDEYTKQLFFGACEKDAEITEIISEFTKSWKIGRISKVSLSVLKIAIYEMLFVPEVSHAVAINEAVEISKIYEGKEASAFVNGVLGAVSKEYNENSGN